jgi:hypothetical protein
MGDVKFIDGIVEKYPIELLEGREIIEGNIVGLLWRYLYLLDIYEDLKVDDFVTEDGRIYFMMIKGMKEDGFTVIDEISVLTFLSTKPELKTIFDKKGGFRAINSLAILLNEINMPKYHDDLLKFNLLMGLHDKGFNVVKEIQKFRLMSSNDVYNYFDMVLNDLFIKKSLDLETADLSSGYDAFIEKANSGQNMGISYAEASPIMNYQTAGLRKGCTIVASTTSGGKSSWLAHHYIINFVEKGHRIVLIINEEDEDSWRSLILTTVINTKIIKWDESKGEYNHKSISRKRFLQGGFTEEEMYLINEAKKWLAQYPKSIEYVKCFDYKIETVKKIVGKYSKLGYDICMLDTFKAPDGAGDNPAWKQMTEGSKALFQACAKADMYLIITAQVALRYNSVRKLTCENLGGATQISEIAHTVVIFRDLWEDEIDEDDKKYIKPYNYIKGADGKWLSSTKEETLRSDKKYAVAFLAKCRAGEKGAEILYRKDIAFNVWKEIGYCSIAQF